MIELLFLSFSALKSFEQHIADSDHLYIWLVAEIKQKTEMKRLDNRMNRPFSRGQWYKNKNNIRMKKKTCKTRQVMPYLSCTRRQPRSGASSVPVAMSLVHTNPQNPNQHWGEEYCLTQNDSFNLGWTPPSRQSFLWMKGLRPLEPEELFAQHNCLSAPFHGVVKAVWLRVLLNDVWINACSYTQLGDAVQGIIERLH